MIEEPYELKVDKYVFKVPRDRLYTENDSWVRIDGDLATVGITDFIQNMASDILFVQFSEVGTKIQQFDELGTFESVKTMLDVISPVSGTIVEVNNRLELEPELLNRDPYGEGWFMRI
ncbi:MAG: glycine cleavage system protein GcvH, partial [Candidatus Bathyarchaeia archaeon]